MVKEAEEFAEEDKLQKDKIEAKNSFENYLYHLKTQVSDDKEWGGKLSAEDKKTLLDAIKVKMDWMDEHATSAAKEDFEEQKADLEQIVNPITSKLHGDAKSSGDATQEDPKHDEL